MSIYTHNIRAVIRAVDQASQTFKEVGDNADKMGTKISRVGQLAQIAGNLMLVSFATAAGAAIHTFIREGIEDFRKFQNEIMGPFRNTFKLLGEDFETTGPKIMDQLKRMADPTVFKRDEVIDAFNRIGRSAKSTSEAIDLVRAAMDIAAGSGRSLKDVADDIAKKLKDTSGSFNTLEDAVKVVLGQYGEFTITGKDILDQLEAMGVELDQDVNPETFIWRDAIDALDRALKNGTITRTKYFEFLQSHVPHLVSAKERTRELSTVLADAAEKYAGLSTNVDEDTLKMKQWDDRMKEVERTAGGKLLPVVDTLRIGFLAFGAGVVISAEQVVKGWSMILEQWTTKIIPAFSSGLSYLEGRFSEVFSSIGNTVSTALADAWSSIQNFFANLKLPQIQLPSWLNPFAPKPTPEKQGPPVRPGSGVMPPQTLPPQPVISNLIPEGLAADFSRFELQLGMQRGGIVSKPTLALLGEAGPEAVVPLNRGMHNVTIHGPLVVIEGSADRKTAEYAAELIWQRLNGRLRG